MSNTCPLARRGGSFRLGARPCRLLAIRKDREWNMELMGTSAALSVRAADAAALNGALPIAMAACAELDKNSASSSPRAKPQLGLAGGRRAPVVIADSTREVLALALGYAAASVSGSRRRAVRRRQSPPAGARAARGRAAARTRRGRPACSAAHGRCRASCTGRGRPACRNSVPPALPCGASPRARTLWRADPRPRGVRAAAAP